MSQLRELVLDVAAELHDLRGGDPIWKHTLYPDQYTDAQALGAALRATGSNGIAYPSLRNPGGGCIGLSYPDRASNMIQGLHLDYHWDGSRVDLNRNVGSGEVYRVG